MKILFFENYLTFIKRSVDSEIWRHVYAEVDGEKKDIVENGNLSCAIFVSSILKIFDLIESLHTTVNGTIKDLEKSGWQQIAEPKIGAILIWEKVDFSENNFHKHIGFYVGENLAVSNDFKTGKIILHHFTFDNQRKMEKIFFHPRLS